MEEPNLGVCDSETRCTFYVTQMTYKCKNDHKGLPYKRERKKSSRFLCTRIVWTLKKMCLLRIPVAVERTHPLLCTDPGASESKKTGLLHDGNGGQLLLSTCSSVCEAMYSKAKYIMARFAWRGRTTEKCFLLATKKNKQTRKLRFARICVRATEATVVCFQFTKCQGVFCPHDDTC